MITAGEMIKEVSMLLNIEEDAGMLPGYKKFKHPDGREDVFEPRGQKVTDVQPCLHKQCSECNGTGVNRMGTTCVHMISCPCPSCSPRMSL